MTDSLKYSRLTTAYIIYLSYPEQTLLKMEVTLFQISSGTDRIGLSEYKVDPSSFLCTSIFQTYIIFQMI